jgi:outer membrane protein assembly factor BamE
MLARIRRIIAMRTLVGTVIGISVIGACVLQSGCSMPNFRLPKLHKVAVQQGNVITQRMIDQLKPGLSREQVVFIMGEPIYRNTFDDSRWDYLYSFEIPGDYVERKRLSIFFRDDVMTHFEGDYTPTAITEPEVPESIREQATEKRS